MFAIPGGNVFNRSNRVLTHIISTSQAAMSSSYGPYSTGTAAAGKYALVIINLSSFNRTHRLSNYNNITINGSAPIWLLQGLANQDDASADWGLILMAYKLDVDTSVTVASSDTFAGSGGWGGLWIFTIENGTSPSQINLPTGAANYSIDADKINLILSGSYHYVDPNIATVGPGADVTSLSLYGGDDSAMRMQQLSVLGDGTYEISPHPSTCCDPYSQLISF